MNQVNDGNFIEDFILENSKKSASYTIMSQVPSYKILLGYHLDVGTKKHNKKLLSNIQYNMKYKILAI
jgi:hypothetical protein